MIGLSYQGSFFGSLQPRFDASFTTLQRVHLDPTSWVDVAVGWLEGADTIFDELTAVVCLSGTPASHIGIVSREYEVPCIMATEFADGVPADGTEVEVEGEEGTTTP